jgi:tyrosinase
MTYNPHCLTRDLAPYFASFTINSTMVARALAAPDFAQFDIVAEGGISVPSMTYHGGGHLSVGGDLGVMGDVYASPGDPLFYLHHANMDRLWWQWQQACKISRLFYLITYD